MPARKIFEGHVFKSTNYGYATVIKYHDSRHVDIEFFDTGGRATVCSRAVTTGSVKDLKSPSIYGVGFLGCEGYASLKDLAVTPSYICWKSMLYRSYGSKAACYKDTSVTKSWHNYQTFARWFKEESNYTEGFELDKDILIQGNNEYKPGACVFVPKWLNCILCDPKDTRSKYGLNVRKINSNTFGARVTKFGFKETNFSNALTAERYALKAKAIYYMNQLTRPSVPLQVVAALTKRAFDMLMNSCVR